MDDYTVSLVVPVYNERETVAPFVSAVKDRLADLWPHLEIVFVDDGSTDDTVKLIGRLQEREPNVSLIRLARNFGKEAAMSAAIDLIDSDALVPMDVDLQDPPELVAEFVRIWRGEGIDNVYGIRVDRSADSEAKRMTSGGFYYVFNKLSGRVKIPSNVGDFRLIDRRVVLTLRELPERNRFMKGLFAWPGFTSRGVGYVRPPRIAGKTKWNYWKLWNFALDGIVSFSSLPLRVWSYIGAAVGFLALIYMFYVLLSALIGGIDVPGYASTLCVVLFLGSVQLISVGVLGEYLGRLSQEIKNRPVYVVADVSGPLASGLGPGIKVTRLGITHHDAPRRE